MQGAIIELDVFPRIETEGPGALLQNIVANAGRLLPQGVRRLFGGLYEIGGDGLLAELVFIRVSSGARTVIYVKPGGATYLKIAEGDYRIGVRVLDWREGGGRALRLRRLSWLQGAGLYAGKAWRAVRHPRSYWSRVKVGLRALRQGDGMGFAGGPVSARSDDGPGAWTAAGIDLTVLPCGAELDDAGRDVIRQCTTKWLLLVPFKSRPCAQWAERVSAVASATASAVTALDLENRAGDGLDGPCLQGRFCVDRLAARPQADAAYLVRADALTILDLRWWSQCRWVAEIILALAADLGEDQVRHLPVTIGTRTGAEDTDRVSYQMAMQRYLPAAAEPDPAGVTIVIPTRDRADLLASCLQSLTLIEDPPLQIVVVDNGSTTAAMREMRAEWSSRRDVTWIYHDIPFNFSRLCNLGAACAIHPVLAFLNDDVEARDGVWLKAMVSYLRRSDVGAVGPRLFYPDGTLQHAGIATHLVPGPGHPWRGQALVPHHPVVDYPGTVDAVTAACLVMRRDDFAAVGGFDEQAFPITMNDVVLCSELRRRGLKIIYAPEAGLLHKEGQSRRPDDDPAEIERRRTEVQAFLRRFPDFAETSVFYPSGLRRDTDQALPI